MNKKLYTDEEMRKQWDDLEAAWVVLDAWAVEETGKPLKRTSMRPDEYKKAPDTDPLRPSPVKDATEAADQKDWNQELGRRMVEASKRMETDPEYRKYIQSMTR